MLSRILIVLTICLCASNQALSKDKELTIAFGLENYDFTNIISKFSEETGISVSTHPFKNNDLKAELIQRSATAQLPDAVIVPSDFIGIKEIKFSVIPENLLSKELSTQALKSAQVGNTNFGIPIIAGNHLFMMYNKSLVQKPAISWEQLLVQKSQLSSGIDLITWSYHEMYWFIPFLGVFGDFPYIDSKPNLDTEGMRNAIKWYNSLSTDEIIDSNCDYSCSEQKFIAGESAYIINGSWSYSGFLEALGDNLGVALLPNYKGRPMQPYFSSHVIAFPDNGLSEEKAYELELLARFFQRLDIQRFIWQEMRSLPTNVIVMNEIMALDDDHIDTIIQQLMSAEPIPNNNDMSIVWEAMLKGVNRYHAGIFSLKKTTEYMQHIAEKSIAND